VHPDEFVQDVLAQYFDEGTRFVSAAKRGVASLRRGEHLSCMRKLVNVSSDFCDLDANPLVT
jgi:hypothetical protein